MTKSLLNIRRLQNLFFFLANAVATSIYLLNISPSMVVLNQRPYETWQGRRSLVTYLRIFDCIVYALISSQFHQKLEEKLDIAINPKYIGCIILFMAK